MRRPLTTMVAKMLEAILARSAGVASSSAAAADLLLWS